MLSSIVARGLLRPNLSIIRMCSSKCPNSRNEYEPSLPELESHDDPSVLGKAKKNVFYSFFDYIKDYNAKIAKVIPPKAVEAYTLFKAGTALLFKDMWVFAKAYDTLSTTDDLDEACTLLSYRTLELYLSLPSDLYVVIPVIALSSLPIVGYGTMALAMLYPKYLLSSHYWSEAIQKEVHHDRLYDRHMHYQKLLLDLPRYIWLMKDKPYYEKCKVMFKKLESGQHPKASEVLEVRQAFVRGCTFDIDNLGAPHLRHLVKIHGLSYLTLHRKRLPEYGNLLLQIDLALVREGGPGVLSIDELGTACFRRGLNTDGLSRSEMEEYLSDWLAISSKLNKHYLSLILHLPILLGFNKKTRHKKDPFLVHFKKNIGLPIE